MVITSFHAIRHRVGRTQGRVLRWVGVCFLLHTVASTYVDEITYYDDRRVIYYIYAAAGALTRFLRIAA